MTKAELIVVLEALATRWDDTNLANGPSFADELRAVIAAEAEEKEEDRWQFDQAASGPRMRWFDGKWEAIAFYNGTWAVVYDGLTLRLGEGEDGLRRAQEKALQCLKTEQDLMGRMKCTDFKSMLKHTNIKVLQELLGLSDEEMQEIARKWHEAYPKVRELRYLHEPYDPDEER